MKIGPQLRDDAVLVELGRRLARARLERNLTQAALAKEAGVSKRTLERIEAGGSTQTASLLRVLRALDLLGVLDALLPRDAPGPMELLARRGRPRRRAASPGRAGAGPAPWHWDEPE